MTTDWRKKKPIFLMKPVDDEKKKVSQLVAQLVSKSEVELLKSFGMTKFST